MRGERFNPRDFSIVGTDPLTGEPVVGAVPSMRMWHAAKVGMDAFLRSPEAYDQFGHLNAIGRAYSIARAEMVKELDRLNPDYKPARDNWAGHTRVMEALNEGMRIFDERHFMDVDHLREHFESLGDSEKQAFITGVRQQLSNRMDRLRASQDQSTPFSTPLVRDRLSAVLGPAAEQLLEKVEREHTTKVTSNETLRGSPTAPRLADDAAAARDRMNAIRRVAHDLRYGGWTRAGAGMLGTAMDRYLGTHFDERARARQDIVNDIMARHLIDPSLALNPTGPLLSPIPGPPRQFPLPGTSYTLGATLVPEDRRR
jgi:hypothetical protein